MLLHLCMYSTYHHVCIQRKIYFSTALHILARAYLQGVQKRWKSLNNSENMIEKMFQRRVAEFQMTRYVPVSNTSMTLKRSLLRSRTVHLKTFK